MTNSNNIKRSEYEEKRDVILADFLWKDQSKAIRVKWLPAQHIHTNFQSVVGGYCDEIPIDAIPNYIAELKKQLKEIK